MSVLIETNYLIERSQLINDVKELVIETLNLDINKEHLHNDEPLFGGNLGLDSIDVLQLVVAINAKMNVEITETQIHEIRSVNTLVDYLEKCKGKLKSFNTIPESYSITTADKNFDSTYNAVRNNILLTQRNDLVILKLNDVSSISNANDLFTRDIELIPENTIKVVLLLNQDGTLHEVVYVYNNFDHYFVVCKTEARQQITDYLQSKDVAFEDLTNKFSLIEITGPLSRQLVEDKLGMSASRLGVLSFTVEQVEDTEIIISRKDSVGEFQFLMAFDKTKEKFIIDLLCKDSSEVIVADKIPELIALESGSFQSRLSKEPISLFTLGLGILVDQDREFFGRENIFSPAHDKSLVYFYMDSDEFSASEICKGDQVAIRNKVIGKISNVFYSELCKKFVGTAYLETEYAHASMEYSVKNFTIKTASAPLVIGKSYLTNENA